MKTYKSLTIEEYRKVYSEYSEDAKIVLKDITNFPDYKEEIRNRPFVIILFSSVFLQNNENEDRYEEEYARTIREICQFNEVSFIKLIVDDTNLIEEFNLTDLKTLIIFKDGIEIKRFIPENMKTLLEYLKGFNFKKDTSALGEYIEEVKG